LNSLTEMLKTNHNKYELMIDDRYGEFPNVAVVDNLILIGEKHNCPESGQLASNICSQVDPAVFAVEQSPIYRRSKTSHITTDSGAIEYLEGYSSTRDVPLFYIDLPADEFTEQFESAIPEIFSLYEAKLVANEFDDPIADSGRVTENSISTARETVRAVLGEETYEILYTERERYMAQQLNWLRDEFSDPVVVAIGAFHTQALVDELQSCSTIQSPKELQVYEPF